ncbi:helix-turn-helix domain-containing protein [Paenibacillus flagellatus]|uniref:AraC family transcriptional regulator n=1 Tax=Paenibacillus flagellatus TaxID=2211139 RepID=A0A2V5JZ07_9BACL|nr:helix-turn-helix domain-containing protein [Paenibacillus flagellatus]PYI51522.1 AraC family transcriptional regulator [Paenibacillus flagellatus]
MIRISDLMPRLRKRGRSRVLNAMIVSNMLILLLPMAMGLFLYVWVEKVMEHNAERSNSAMLEQLRLSVDNKLKEVDILAKQVAFNPKLNFLLNTEGDDRTESYRQVEFVRDYLNRYQSFVSGFVKDFYVHVQTGDVILKPGLRTDARTFYDKYYKYRDMDYEAWRQSVLSGYRNMAYLPSRVLLQNPEDGDGNPAGVITYVQSLPLHDVSGMRGALVILIDEEQVQDMFRQIETANDSAIYIVDRNRTVIASTGQGEPLPERVLNRLAGPSGLFDEPLDGVDSMISYTSSEQTGWHYVSVMPMDRFMQRVTQIKKLALTVLVFSLVIGAVAACGFAYRHYRPVKRTVDAIMQGKPIAGRSVANEYEFIRQTIEGSFTEERHLRDRLSRQTPAIRANFLSRLIRGHVDPEQVEEEQLSLDFMGVRFESERFAVFLVQVEEISRFGGEQTERLWAQIRFIVSNIGTDVANARHLGYAVDLERDRVAFLINFRETGAAEAEELHEMAETLHTIMKERFAVSLTIAASGVHEGAGRIGAAYLEAMAALDYRMFKGRNAIIHFGDIREAKPHYYYPIEFEVQLVNSVKSGDAEHVGKLLDNLFEMNFHSGGMTPELGKCLFFNIVSTFLKIINASNLDPDALLGRDFDPVKQLFGCGTAEEMHAETKRLYDTLARSFQTDASDHSKQLLHDMMSFVERNLSDANLGLTMIADQFGMTPQYVSSFFKKTSGHNLIDHITRSRIEMAKRLMERSELTNAQLAQMVGYTNDVVFIRAFKKLEGVTPGKYRVSAFAP